LYYSTMCLNLNYENLQHLIEKYFSPLFFCCSI
jgi:hypothetical protein